MTWPDHIVRDLKLQVSKQSEATIAVWLGRIDGAKLANFAVTSVFHRDFPWSGTACIPLQEEELKRLSDICLEVAAKMRELNSAEQQEQTK